MKPNFKLFYRVASGSAIRLLLLAPIAFLTACISIPSIQNSTGQSSMTVDSSRQGPVSGTGIEGQDIVSMTDKMMRDMLANPRLAGLIAKLPGPPVITLDAADFENLSSQALQKEQIANRLRIGLQQAANGRMDFVNFKQTARTERSRAQKRAGTTTAGVTGLTKATDGEDWYMSGQITSSEQRNTKSGYTQRYTQISFELTDAESNRIIWSGLYEFTRAAADDVVYR